MKMTVRIVVGIFAALGVLFVAMSVIALFFPNSCNSIDLGSVTSPDNRFRAKQILRNCEKEDYIQTEVRLIKVDGDPHRSWGVFGAQSERLGGGGFRPVSIEVSWLAEKELQITYPRDANVFMSDSDVEGIYVAFVRSDTMSR